MQQGTGNTPPVSPPQGNNGGAGTRSTSSCTALVEVVLQAGAVQEELTVNPAPQAGAGGAGATTSITGSPTTS